MLTFESVDAILWCDFCTEPFIFHYFTKKLGMFPEFGCLALLGAIKGLIFFYRTLCTLSYQVFVLFSFQLTGLPTTSGAVGNKEAAPKQAVADADADLQAR